MANSRGKRKLLRMLQEAGLDKLLPPASPPSHSLSLLVARWTVGIIGLFGALATLYALYPWLAVEKNEMLDPENPYSALFYVVNDGFWPVSDLAVDCSPNLFASGTSSAIGPFVMRGNTFDFYKVAEYLPHAGHASIPCFLMITQDPNLKGIFSIGKQQKIKSATLTIDITCSFYPFTWERLRKHQSFNFRATQDTQGNLQWLYVD